MKSELSFCTQTNKEGSILYLWRWDDKLMAAWLYTVFLSFSSLNLFYFFYLLFLFWIGCSLLVLLMTVT